MQLVRQRILCVEDNVDSCELLSIILGNAGYEFAAAHTASEALNKVLTGGFDLILLDNHLPDGSGLGLCKQIREFNSYTPICFYTSDAVAKPIEAAMTAGS